MSLISSFNDIVVLYHYYHNCHGTAILLNNRRVCYPLFRYDVFYLIHGDATMHKLSLQLGVVHVSYMYTYQLWYTGQNTNTYITMYIMHSPLTSHRLKCLFSENSVQLQATSMVHQFPVMPCNRLLLVACNSIILYIVKQSAIKTGSYVGDLVQWSFGFVTKEISLNS